MSEIILSLKDVNKSFQSGDSTVLNILSGVSLEVKEGQSIAITGPSGCGKSTLLNVIGTLDKPDSGSIEITGTFASALNSDSLAELRLNKIGFVFQKHHLLPQLTALENVLLPTLKKPSAENIPYAKELLEKVGLKERMDHRPGQLSGGECQRVALCRALINKPKILLADEPTGALDSKSSNQLIDLLIKLNKEENLTLITVTHSSDLKEKMQIHYSLSEGKLEKS
ncbi:MAG: ABC transporter ATP-binding protein [Lentisphaeraceae bacterium]|nr:ABC transporter ATP-binding protein [Lentisphaeraceae bacterium]